MGKAITVTVSYTDGGTAAESLTSPATSVVTNINDAPTGLPTITGTPTQGQTLTAVIDDITDADGLGTFSYQWQAGGNDISGATESTFVLTQAQVGKAITVTVSYTDGGNTAESLTSAATSVVTNTNDDPNRFADHHWHTDPRPNPDRGHRRHYRCRWPRRLQLSMAGQRQ